MKEDELEEGEEVEEGEAVDDEEEIEEGLLGSEGSHVDEGNKEVANLNLALWFNLNNTIQKMSPVKCSELAGMSNDLLS